ncbi:DUF7683 domain-containing protein [Ornithinibacillus scapharcae]|uniref:DUF7683 domain-containing protein n=1 Tax=Ornithinibacillus scapharcae TaxID=1147159 RepID=UPI000225BD39|nr:hypothetical protein [Ornithinibacillus scapharcae]
MASAINYQYRITKYNPIYRNSFGEYTKEEWISSSQIGKTFDGEVFTIVDYFQVEASYINTILSFMKESQINSLRVVLLDNERFQDESSELFEEKFKEVILEEDLLVSEKDIAIICQMVLREFIHCLLISGDDFFVHFGYDYYMYIGSNQPCKLGIDFARENGLFVEEYQSPYYLAEEDIMRTIEWTAKENESILGDEDLSMVPLKEFQKALNLSEDHPVVGSFRITSKNKDFFQQYMEHKLDFSKYNYFLFGGN